MTQKHTKRGKRDYGPIHLPQRNAENAKGSSGELPRAFARRANLKTATANHREWGKAGGGLTTKITKHTKRGKGTKGPFISRKGVFRRGELPRAFFADILVGLRSLNEAHEAGEKGLRTYSLAAKERRDRKGFFRRGELPRAFARRANMKTATANQREGGKAGGGLTTKITKHTKQGKRDCGPIH
jgi:hypothetical protein